MSSYRTSASSSPFFKKESTNSSFTSTDNTESTLDQLHKKKESEIEKKHKNSFKYVGGEDDIFIVNNNGSSFELHRKNLKETLKELKKQAYSSVRQLKSEHTESFRSIVEALRLLYDSQPLYELILKDVHEIFYDVKDVKPGTVAAFFTGCFANHGNSQIPMGCTPTCAGSLAPPESEESYSNCDDLVLIYLNGQFSSLNEKRSSHAYIYIENKSDFKGFTPQNISQLKDAEITKVSIIYNKEVSNIVPLELLPKESDTQTDQTQVIIAVVVVVVILLLLGVVFYFVNRQGKLSYNATGYTVDGVAMGRINSNWG